MLYIDGSHGEGGGQIIRTALSLSALTQKPFEITNIRNNRPKPGLQAQHLTAVRAVADMCNADVTGAEPGSTSFLFIPKDIKQGGYRWDIGTEGSVTLVLQALLPAALHCGKEFEFTVTGGTDVQWSPPVEHFQHVFCNYLEKMGAKLEFSVIKHGFYPKGGGIVKLHAMPSKLKPLAITERGTLKSIDIWSIASTQLMNAKVAERQVSGFRKIIFENTGKAHNNYVKSDSPGSCIHAHSRYENCVLGAECLGERNKTAEAVGKECAEKLKKEMETGATADVHATDQLLPYLAMFGGSIRSDALSEHAKTNMWLIEQFLDARFRIEGNIIKCKKDD